MFIYSKMTELTMESFYPENIIKCEADLPFEDGTYDVVEREDILNIIEIKNHRITHHHQYNAKMKLRLITWTFDYLTAEDGTQIHNIWRQPRGTIERDMYASTHWHLYPEHHKKHIENTTRSKEKWNNFFNNPHEYL